MQTRKASKYWRMGKPLCHRSTLWPNYPNYRDPVSMMTIGGLKWRYEYVLLIKENHLSVVRFRRLQRGRELYNADSEL